MSRPYCYLKIKNVDYHSITEIRKSETIKVLQNIDLTKKKFNIINIKSSFDVTNLLEN